MDLPKLPINIKDLETAYDWLLNNVPKIIAHGISENHCTCCAYEAIYIAVKDNSRLGISMYSYYAKRNHSGEPGCGYRCGCMEFIWSGLSPKLRIFENDDS